MLDGVSLDQLRTFIAAADEGSFSAGGRRLRRAQSVVSQTLANLEAQLGVKLFDRSSRSPVLTSQGVALLAEARAVVSRMDVFKARAKGLSDGLEPELSVVVDVIFPLERLTAAVAAFQGEFPAVPLRLYVEALGAVLQPVLDGRCAFGGMGSLPTAPAEPSREHPLNLGWAVVASPTPPVASIHGAIPAPGVGVGDRPSQVRVTTRRSPRRRHPRCRAWRASRGRSFRALPGRARRAQPAQCSCPRRASSLRGRSRRLREGRSSRRR